MIAPPRQLIEAGFRSAILASVAFAAVFFLSLVGFLPGVFTVGILAYVLSID